MEPTDEEEMWNRIQEYYPEIIEIAENRRYNGRLIAKWGKIAIWGMAIATFLTFLFSKVQAWILHVSKGGP